MTNNPGYILVFQLLMLGMQALLSAASPQRPQAEDPFQTQVKPFLKTYCLKCHGVESPKGEMDLHNLEGKLAEGVDLKKWEAVLDVLESGEMPPDDELQPKNSTSKTVTDWIEKELSRLAETPKNAPETSTRRLTNFEYQNTMRDLLGIDLQLIQNLPKDPGKPYRFNNTAEFMLLGPEQIDRYLEAARKAMASVIVDPDKKPVTEKSRQQWDSKDSNKGFAKSLKRNEIAIQNSRRGTPGQGMVVKKFPRTGEFRIRFQASAVFPNGETELPLRFVMGYNLNINSSTQEIAPVGIVGIRNTSEKPQIYEFRGRIENYPVQVGKVVKGRRRPDTLTITPQNIYDDGTLNDDNRFLYWPRQTEMPRAVVDWIEFEAPLTDVWPPTHHTRILFDSPLRQENPTQYIEQVLARFMSRAYRRPATKQEVGRFLQIYQLLQPDLLTVEATMRETLAMVLVTPQFLLHTQADGETVAEDFELASKLSYFLWGSMPDQRLLELAAKGELDDSEVVRNQVKRMLADPRSKDFVSNFTNQWLSLPKMKTVPINRDLFPRFLYYVEAGERAGTEKPYIPTIRDHMIAETEAFVAELIARNASVTNLVDSDFAMLNQPLAAHYGVGGVEGHRLRPVTIKPTHHLGGLLTHGSILIGNGTGSAPHPIYRAVWLREAILGDHVKAPPAEVPALSDSAGDSAEEALNIKDLLAKHRSVESCNACHSRLDPWGIPFERYNAIGKYQPLIPQPGTRVRGFNKKVDLDLAGYEKYIKSINTREVQAEAIVPRGPTVNGMRDLKEHLLKSRMDDIGRNVVQRLMTYGIGRELNWRDRYDINQIVAQAKKHNWRMQDIIVSVCQSPTFRGKSN